MKTTIKLMLVLTSVVVVSLLIFSDKASAATNVFYSNLNSLSDAQNPTIGPSGTTNLSSGDFVTGKIGNGANFSNNNSYLQYPTDAIFQDSEGAIPKKRAIEFWYKPNYNQNSDTRDYFLMSDSSDRFYIKYLNSDNSVRLFIKLSSTHDMSLASKQSVNWQSGDWIHIQAFWYDVYVVDLDPKTLIIPKILVNGEVSEFSHNGQYKAVSAATNLFIGNKNDSSSLSANGTIDEVRIYDRIWSPNINSISPKNPDQGDLITISGTDFGPPENSTVTIDGVKAIISSWNETEIKAIVPSVNSGTKNVIVSTWGQMESNSESLIIGKSSSVSNLKATNITKSSADISWQTSKKSKTIIDWGKTISYKNNFTSPNYKKVHSITLSNLSPGTKYNFKVSTKDQYGNQGSTSNFSFTTKKRGLIINSPITETSIEFISASETEEYLSEKKSKQKTEKIDEKIIVIDNNKNKIILNEHNYLKGDNFIFSGQTLPNTNICLILFKQEKESICTDSDTNGYWQVEIGGINPGEYQIWTEIPENNSQSKIFNVNVASAKDQKDSTNKSKNNYLLFTTIIIFSLIIITSITIYLKKRKS